MITSDKKIRAVEGSEAIDQMDYFIDQKNLVHVTAMLRNMYSNPVKACVREYAANAIDSHRLAGIADRPIEVTVPCSLAPTFKVRDFGAGLSVEETKLLLCGYGSSGEHKRNSNGYIGGFGIGSKVGFAVSSAFTFTIWNGGKKRVWSCYLGEFDDSKASLLSEEDSDEPTGVEVAVPVSNDRVREFINECETAFVWYKVKPTIIGSTITIKDPPPVAVEDKLHVVTEKGHKLEVLFQLINNSDRSNSRVGVVMGDIEYPVSISDTTVGINPNSLPYKQQRLLNGILIHAPIGAFQLAPSRESLQYSQHTKALLNKIFKKILEDGYILGLFSQKAFAVTAPKTMLGAWASAKFYADLLGENITDCIRKLFPSYKKHVVSLHNGTSFHPIAGIDIVEYKGQTTADSYQTIRPVPADRDRVQAHHLCASALNWYSSASSSDISRLVASDRTWIGDAAVMSGESRTYAVFMTAEQFEAACLTDGLFGPTAKLNAMRRILLSAARRDGAEWSGTGKDFTALLNSRGTLHFLLCASPSDAATAKVVRTAIDEGLVTEIAYTDFIAENPADGAELISQGRTGKTSSRAARSPRSTDSKKFSSLKAESSGMSRQSANWHSLAAKKVSKDVGYAVPMDGFVVSSMSASGLDGLCSTGCSTDRDDMRWLQTSVLSARNAHEYILQGKPILGIRVAEYTATLAHYGLPSLYARLKEYVKEYITRKHVTNDMLACLFLLTIRTDSEDDRAKVLQPEALKLALTLLEGLKLREQFDAMPLDAEYQALVPPLRWAQDMIDTEDEEEQVFRDFFVSSFNHHKPTVLGHPFVQCEADLLFWNGFCALVLDAVDTRGSQAWISQDPLDMDKFKSTPIIVVHAAVNVYLKYPGLSAFIPDDAERGSVRTHWKELMWDMVYRGDDKVAELNDRLTQHILDYVSSTKPMERD